VIIQPVLDRGGKDEHSRGQTVRFFLFLWKIFQFKVSQKTGSAQTGFIRLEEVSPISRLRGLRLVPPDRGRRG
jgi:hypothetical protein